MPNKRNKKNNRMNKRYRRRFRRRLGSNKFNICKYQYRTRPATFGPGYYKLSVTKLFTGRLDVQQEINIYNDILATNPEFGRINTDFKYTKMLGIMLTFMARNLSGDGNMTPAYVLLNYDGVKTQNIRLQDNVKVVPAFLIKDRIIRYNIPRIVTSYGGALSDWIFTEDTIKYSDLMLQIVAPSNTTNWYIRVDVIMIFRGPTNKEETRVEIFKNKNNNENNNEIEKINEKENKDNNKLKENKNKIINYNNKEENMNNEDEKDKQIIKNEENSKVIIKNKENEDEIDKMINDYYDGKLKEMMDEIKEEDELNSEIYEEVINGYTKLIESLEHHKEDQDNVNQNGPEREKASLNLTTSLSEKH